MFKTTPPHPAAPATSPDPSSSVAPDPASAEAAPAPVPLDDTQAVSAADLIQAELRVVQTQCAELSENYLRAKADAENARRRAEDEIAKARKFAVESFAQNLLPVLDSLEASLVVQDATPEQIRAGAQATLQQLTSALERSKIVVIAPAVGTKFDPHQHQAISVVPLAEASAQEANTVVSVLQKGYLIADRVLRPALVTVAAAQ